MTEIMPVPRILILLSYQQGALTGLFFAFAVLLASAFLLRDYQPPGFSPSERMPSVSRTRPFSTISS